MSSHPECTAPDCTKPSKYKTTGYCPMHYKRLSLYGTLTAPARPTTCMYVDCDNKHKAHNLCDLHYRWTRQPLPPHCQHPGCSRLPRNNDSTCSRHRPAPVPPTPAEDDNLHIILDEYRHFKGFGWDDEKIANRLGTNVQAFTKRMQRNGMQVAS